ncbi:MAG: hypothetical protein ABI824_19450 [Acidobacteriota bacterium]
MIKRILALSGMTVAVALAQAPKPAPAKPAAAQAKPAAAKAAGKAVSNYTPPKTSWGEPDLQGTWPLDNLISVGLERKAQNANKAELSDAEIATAQAAMDKRNAAPKAAIPVADTSKKVLKQTSLIVDPPNGKFPALTERGKNLQSEMQSSYKPGKNSYDGIEDFSSWDHCITRGMPVSMEPRNYNNGLRITQAPGYVIILLEMAHEARVIPTTPIPKLDGAIKQYMGESRGHWEGNTLVVETTNFNGLTGQTSAGVPSSPGPLQPETTNFKTVERFTRTGPDTLEFKMVVSDPEVMVSDYTVAYPLFLDNSYEMYEYACHEGNTAIRNYIETSRFERHKPK